MQGTGNTSTGNTGREQRVQSSNGRASKVRAARATLSPASSHLRPLVELLDPVQHGGAVQLQLLGQPLHLWGPCAWAAPHESMSCDHPSRQGCHSRRLLVPRLQATLARRPTRCQAARTSILRLLLRAHVCSRRSTFHASSSRGMYARRLRSSGRSHHPFPSSSSSSSSSPAAQRLLLRPSPRAVCGTSGSCSLPSSCSCMRAWVCAVQRIEGMDDCKGGASTPCKQRGVRMRACVRAMRACLHQPTHKTEGARARPSASVPSAPCATLPHAPPTSRRSAPRPRSPG